MLEEVKTKFDELVSKMEELHTAVKSAESVASLDVNKPIVEAMIAALEAQGYTVTPPAAPAE